MNDQDIVAMYWQREEQAIRVTKVFDSSAGDLVKERISSL